MVKRKASVSSSEDESNESSRKSQNNIKQSLINAANLMSKSQLLHKSLNLNNNSLNTIDDSDNMVKNSKSKQKKKSKPSRQSFSNSEDDQTEITPKKDMTPISKKPYNSSEKSPKSIKTKSKDKGNFNSSPDSFTPIKLPKKETNEYYDKNNTHSEKNMSQECSSEESESEFKSEESYILDGGITQTNSRHSNNEPSDDAKMMDLIENNVEKVRIIQDIKISPQKDPKQHLNEIYPNLRQKNLKTKLEVNDVDEIYMFRIPKNIDPQNLLDVNIDLKNGGKIKIGEKYVIRPTSRIPHPALVVSSNNKVINFKHNIVMEKYIKKHKEVKIPVVENASVPLPNDLKNRHPLFGSNFEEKIILDEIVEQKLDDAIKNLLKVRKRKNKKQMGIETDEIVFNLLKNTGPCHETSSNSFNTGLPKKKTSSKKKMTKNDLIQETLRIMKQELHTENETDSGISPNKKKKKNKSKNSSVVSDDSTIPNSLLSNTNIKEEKLEDNFNISVKQRKKKMSLVNSTLLTDTPRIPKFNPEVSYISHDSADKMSKKRKIKEEHNESFSSMKKKKKKGIEVD